MTVSQASDPSPSLPCPLAYHGPDPEPFWAYSLGPCGAGFTSSHRSLCFRLLPFDLPQGFCLSAYSYFFLEGLARPLILLAGGKCSPLPGPTSASNPLLLKLPDSSL